jgi:C4-dicarboxylate-specific signal transduction histidine kinase
MRPHRRQALSSVERKSEAILTALRRCEALRAASEGLGSTGSFWWRLATDDIVCSEELCRILELEPLPRFTRGALLERFYPDDRAVIQEVIDRACVIGADIACESRVLMRDQSVKHVHVIARATRDGDRGFEYIGAVQDLTRARQADEALAEERAELARRARVTTFPSLTSAIVHEINQPLAGITTNAETCLRMLAAKPPNIEGARETAHRTVRDGHRAAEVIARLRSLFAKRCGNTELLDLSDVVREAIALASAQLEQQRVIIRSELADHLPAVMGDRVQLQQVIMNLLMNAAEAMSGVDDRLRCLCIRTVLDHVSRVRVLVCDAGIGVPPQNADRLFEPFYTTKPGGMGIGLSISRAIIQNHGGHLWVAHNDGPGSTFAFSLPASRP